MKELPEGWEWKKLSELIEKTSKANPSEDFPDDNFEYIDISSIDNENKVIISTKTMKGRDAPSRARQVVKSGDLLVSTVRPNLNAVALIPPKYDNEICSTGFCILRTDKQQIIPEYLYLISRSEYFISSLVKACSGANYPAVRSSDVKSVLIPLPPLPTQRRIVAILEKAEQGKNWHSEQS